MPQIVNKITKVTRQRIADEVTANKIPYSGKLSEPDFLGRHFDLENLPSNDSHNSNAYHEIYRHTVRWPEDWEDGWVWTDRRFNLLHCPDDTYLNFICDTLHPAVRFVEEEFQKLLEIYNRRLAQDGHELYVSDHISTMPVYSYRKVSLGTEYMEQKKTNIIKYLDTDYVRGKINIMSNAITTDPDLAIGTAKELIETICKSILASKGITPSKDWELQKLFSKTLGVIEFDKIEVLDNAEKGKESIKKVVGGLNGVIQGLAELRNSYGSGHGKSADFVQMDQKYVKFLVDVVADVSIFILGLTDEKTERSK